MLILSCTVIAAIFFLIGERSERMRRLRDVTIMPGYEADYGGMDADDGGKWLKRDDVMRLLGAKIAPETIVQRTTKPNSAFTNASKTLRRAYVARVEGVPLRYSSFQDDEGRSRMVDIFPSRFVDVREASDDSTPPNSR